MKSALARLTLILHPPEKSFVSFPCMACVNPSPDSIPLALVSAVAASRSSSLSYVAVSISMSTSCFSSALMPPSSSAWPDSAASVRAVTASFRSSASFSSRARSSSTLMTASRAVIVSDGSTSSLRWKVSIPPGMGTARAPRHFCVLFGLRIFAAFVCCLVFSGLAAASESANYSFSSHHECALPASISVGTKNSTVVSPPDEADILPETPHLACTPLTSR